MTEGLGLALAFAEHEPESCARLLEELPAVQAALFLDQLAERDAAGVLEHMTPGSAARRLSLLDATRVSAMLEALDSRDSVAILRACTPDTRRGLLGELPGRLVQHYRRSLAYTLDTVGAWIDYDVPTLPAQRTVEDARTLLRQRHRNDDGQVFLVRTSRTYAGTVPLPALLHAEPDTPLLRLIDRRVRVLSDTVDVDDAQRLDDWDERSQLPVTAPDGSLLGALSRTALRRALHAVQPQAPVAQPDSLLAHLFLTYLETGSEFLRLLIGRGHSSRAARSAHER